MADRADPGTAAGAVSRARALTDRAAGGASAALLAALVLDVIWQVAARFSPVGIPAGLTAFTEELARVLLLWLTLIGGAYAAGRGAHLAIDLVSRRLGGRALAVHRVSVHVATAAFAGLVLLLGGAGLVRLTLELEQVAASLRVPTGVIYLALPIGGAVTLWYAALGVAAALTGDGDGGGGAWTP